ncbi:MAG TPA: 4-alpha-glucanotransferase [Armatimonadetes bacterium]|nr:4-alpha-glucanotransferase [Armatimonadota bacterium]
MPFERAAGVLLHPTSLPGPYGIGDLGPTAHQWVDWLASAEVKWWQILPLGPTGYGNSPYSALSAFALNPLLISPEVLAEWGLLTAAEIAPAVAFAADEVEFGPVAEHKAALLARAWERFRAGDQPALTQAADEFLARPEIGGWAYDYALYLALKEAHDGAEWFNFEPGAAQREPAALAEWREKLAPRIDFHLFCQWAVYRQWMGLRAHAHELEVRIIGDLPIFVSYDSADVWCNRHLFQLNPDGSRRQVAGVPPDYFAEEGQLWGNPLYDWPANAADGYGWWTARVARSLETVDALRFDHFRGFESYWSVPATAKTALEGAWEQGPGAHLFDHLRGVLGELPIIAEDLGVITTPVKQLRDHFAFPGMRVLQFAFHEGANFYLPHLYPTNTVVYTGTHDNDTTIGWWATATEVERTRALAYLDGEPDDIAAALVRLALGSAADLAVFPLQDLLSLGPEARMNVPGVATGNWGWRVAELPAAEVAAALLKLILLFDRGHELPELM